MREIEHTRKTLEVDLAKRDIEGVLVSLKEHFEQMYREGRFRSERHLVIKTIFAAFGSIVDRRKKIPQGTFEMLREKALSEYEYFVGLIEEAQRDTNRYFYG